MTYQKGDVIDPPEPAVGTRLSSTGPLGSFTIRRHHDGWKIEDKRHSRERFCWRRVIAQYGPGAGQTLTVVKLP